MERRRPVVGFIIGLIALALIIPVSVSHAQLPAEPDGASVRGTKTCQDILVQAVGLTQASCDNLGRNKACYGNNTVKVEPSARAVVKFDVVGDRAAIQDIRTLVTSPLNEQSGTWGLSLLKLQANLPDTSPGQNVTFLVFGNTTVENTTGDMKAFYFSSGLGELKCQEVPHEGILVRSPKHTEVTFSANGVDIAISSSIMMQAVRSQFMSVELVEGHARVTTPQGSQTLQPGQMVYILLGGANGLQPASAPSSPTRAPANPIIGPLIGLTDPIANPGEPPTVLPDGPPTVMPDVPPSVTITGCITAKKGNSIVIDGTSVNVGSDHTLKAAKVGDCVTITGVLKTNSGKGLSFVLVKAAPTDEPDAESDTDQGGAGGAGAGGVSATAKPAASPIPPTRRPPPPTPVPPSSPVPPDNPPGNPNPPDSPPGNPNPPSNPGPPADPGGGKGK